MIQFDVNNLTHFCGGTAEGVECGDGIWSAVCSECGESVDNCTNPDELILKWYRLKPEKECAEEVEESMNKLLVYFTEHDDEIYSKDLLAAGGDGARRALTILDNTGLVKTRYEIDDDPLSDVSIEEALEAKKNGSVVKAFCRRNFILEQI